MRFLKISEKGRLRRALLKTAASLLLGLSIGYSMLLCFKSFLNILDRINLLERHLTLLEKNRSEMARYLELLTKIESKQGRNKMTNERTVAVTQAIMEACLLNADIGLTEDIVGGLVDAESGWNWRAKSNKNAYGLFQVIRPTMMTYLPKLGVNMWTEEIAFDPLLNTKCGLMYLVDLRKMALADGNDSWVDVISAYERSEALLAEIFNDSKKNRTSGLEHGKKAMRLAKKWREG